MTYLGRDERSSQQHRGREEEKEEERKSLVKWILATKGLKAWSCSFPHGERVYMHMAFQLKAYIQM